MSGCTCACRHDGHDSNHSEEAGGCREGGERGGRGDKAGGLSPLAPSVPHVRPRGEITDTAGNRGKIKINTNTINI